MIRLHLKEYTDEELSNVFYKVKEEQQNRRAANMCRDNEFMDQRKRNYEAALAMEASCSHQEFAKVHWPDTKKGEPVKHYGDKKPMKATAIYKNIHGDLATAPIDLDPSKNILTCVTDWLDWAGFTTATTPQIQLHIVYDGILFEYTSKPVLAEVGTGIEI